MKLTGNLKNQVEATTTKDEARETIRNAGMILDDTELDQVTGGLIDFSLGADSTTPTGDAGEYFCKSCNATKMFMYSTDNKGRVGKESRNGAAPAAPYANAFERCA